MGLINKTVNYLLSREKRRNSATYKIMSLLVGVLFFLVVLPGIFIEIGFFIENHLHLPLNRSIERIISIISLSAGLAIMAWTTIFQWKIGKGVPTPNAPTRHLIVSGPYRFCRNPIELGAILYYLGIGTMIGNILIGIICFLLGLIIGSAYHKFIEERELEIRFGNEYREYKKKTPFLFPKVRFKL